MGGRGAERDEEIERNDAVKTPGRKNDGWTIQNGKPLIGSGVGRWNMDVMRCGAKVADRRDRVSSRLDPQLCYLNPRRRDGRAMIEGQFVAGPP